MLKNIDIAEACNIIYAFAEANDVDALRGIELMVKHFKLLSSTEQEALFVFMDETKKEVG